MIQLVTLLPSATAQRHLSTMGLLALGTPLTWGEAKKYADHVRYHGISQLLNIWKRERDRNGDKLYWGDEVCLSSIILTFQLTLYLKLTSRRLGWDLD